MKLTLVHAASILVVLFTLSLTAYGSENNPAPNTTLDPAPVDPAVIALADKILAEQATTDLSAVNDDFRVAPNSPNSVRSTGSKALVVSKWLEERAVQAGGAVESKVEPHSVVKHAHAHYQDIEADLGGGWCDLCGCWLNHGRDPNGTPQSEIGHPYVCPGGANNQNCWSHYYKYCFSS